jgi:hypothetical protein
VSSRPKWRDLQFSQPAADSDGSTALPFVIPTAVDLRSATPVNDNRGSCMKFVDQALQEIRRMWPSWIRCTFHREHRAPLSIALGWGELHL